MRSFVFPNSVTLPLLVVRIETGMQDGKFSQPDCLRMFSRFPCRRAAVTAPDLGSLIVLVDGEAECCGIRSGSIMI
jgi:hypothetical protein